MVDYKIEDDVNVALLGLAGERVEIRQRSVHGVDVFIVRNVIAEVNLRRRKAGGNPDSVHAKVFQIIELRSNALQIADAVIVAVGKTARIYLIEHGVLPPFMTLRVLGMRCNLRNGTRT